MMLKFWGIELTAWVTSGLLQTLVSTPPELNCPFLFEVTTMYLSPTATFFSKLLHLQSVLWVLILKVSTLYVCDVKRGILLAGRVFFPYGPF